ncbi:MAG: tetratricopeptide repeat protein [Halieaceae bacterium]|nr:tetratricopeptide repeat protein [Halieaceae bacterium]
MESYRTEEEQVEALRRWWQENGRSTIVAIVLALGVGFGYQGWKSHVETSSEGASDLYQRMLQAFSAPALSPEQQQIAVQLAGQLKTEYAGSTYAQFAAMQLARVAVGANDLAAAQSELRWILGKADKGSDVARLAQLRLARVLAAAGEAEQALTILDQGGEGPYKASYAVARGDILLSMGRKDEASESYAAALTLASAQEGAGLDLVAVQQKLQALNPVPARATVQAGSVDPVATPAQAESGDTAEPAGDTGVGEEG